jgi:undecaprenyl-diphosphatase
MIRRIFDALKRRWKQLGGLELSLLVSLALVVGGIWSFAELAEELIGEEPHQLDREILLVLRDPQNPDDPVGPLWVEEAMVDFTTLANTALLGLIAAAIVGYFVLRRNYFSAVWILLTILGATLLTTFFKDIFGRARPDIVPALDRVTSPSFPSGHSSAAAATYLTLGVLVARYLDRRRLQVYVLLLAVLIVLLVGFSRVYLGVHWPSDVLGGWVLGTVWAIITLQLELWWERWQARSSDREES